MEILGIGASELFFIFLIVIILLGPKDMQKAGRTIGRWLNQLVHSDNWKLFQKTSAEIRNLPRNLMREANMELQEANAEIQEMDKEIRQTIDPRPRPPAASTSPNPAAEPKPGEPPLNQPDTPPQPPAVPPTEPDDETKQDD
ncbi:MAG: hypothetical protein JW730_07490 [Anaerolineales bacterium]|nr:hypothetical protein [Anaerolineales bacterium]